MLLFALFSNGHGLCLLQNETVMVILLVIYAYMVSNLHYFENLTNIYSYYLRLCFCECVIFKNKSTNKSICENKIVEDSLHCL